MRSLRVLTTCQVSGNPVPTHAHMTERQLRQFRGELVLYCRECSGTHLVERDDVFLEGGSRPATFRRLSTIGFCAAFWLAPDVVWSALPALFA